MLCVEFDLSEGFFVFGPGDSNLEHGLIKWSRKYRDHVFARYSGKSFIDQRRRIVYCNLFARVGNVDGNFYNVWIPVLSFIERS